MTRTRTLFISALTALTLVACSGGDGGGDDAADDTGDAAGGGGATVEVEAGDLYFDPEEASAPAGEIEFVVTNVGDVEHDLVIEEADDTNVAHAEPGETASGTITLEAGTYTYYCSVPGHRSTMEGTLEVS